jgi:hypothetical protein
MRKISNGLLAAMAAGALLLTTPSSARAQVAFGGTFVGPHGSFSIGIGSPAFPVGGYVPHPYAQQVYFVPGYGYGFYYGAQFIPCERIGPRWVVVSAPFAHYGFHGRYWDGGRYWASHRHADFRGQERFRGNVRRDWR